jgi:UDP-galactopyranose mutase
MSRLARRRRVLFVEEPVIAPGPERAEVVRPHPNVTVFRPYTSSGSPGFDDSQIPMLRRMVRELLQGESIDRHWAWFYTPLALPLLDELSPGLVVYDCMDELSAFLNAPAQLLEREAQLFQLADVVFTGGPSLYRAKRDKHPNVHCFPSSVDREHFASASSLPDSPDQAVLPHPRLGYCGVIDERIDLAIIDTLAQEHPASQIVMVGPVVKIDPSTLPRYPNVHYLGQRDYGDLPSFLGGWDVCLLPFALNKATRFISPTKTLEYMAARKLIVSTPILDVVEPYGHIVYGASSPTEFSSACERALEADPAERERRLTAADHVLTTTSWDRTTDAMEQALAEAVDQRERQRPRSGSAVTQSGAAAPPVVVIGAGPTGLSAAYHLGERAVLIEQNDGVGGWCRSVEAGGFTFDYAGHIMFSSDPYVHELYRMLLGDNVHWQDREAWIYSKNVYTRYPFQGSLYGLPPEVIKECITGAIEARFGPLNPVAAKGANGTVNGGTNGAVNGGANGAAKNCSRETISDCCADGILESSAPLHVAAHGQATASAEPRNFEEFIYKVWGSGIAKHFAIPYNRKLWAVPLDQMETSWLGGRVPMPDLEEMIEGALKPTPKPMGPNARFGYPLRGGFQALMDGFLPHLKGRLMLKRRVASIDPNEKVLTLDDGTQERYESLISTMPLPALVRALGSNAPQSIRDAAAKLRHVSVRCVHLGIGRENLTEKHWIYYPEDTVFHRIFVQGNASPHCNPAGGFGLTCEITYSEHKPLPAEGDGLVERCISDCRKVGIIGPDDPVLAATQCDLPFAYVVYDHARKQAVESIRQWLLEMDIILAGRYSEWEYYNSDHAFLAGRRAAEQAGELERQTPKRVPAAAAYWSTLKAV